ncbi:hypothetical protein LMH73_004760 [Vibrio splendidus]|nr:hypothetical protein [Vibrio splendidus]MCC4882540.1 hypothetical protein [Vibrio splendidus]
MFNYTIANCEPIKLLAVFLRLSKVINEHENVFIGLDKLSLRFVSEESTFNINPEDADKMHFGISILDPLHVFGSFFRGDLLLSDLESSYLKALCFSVARKLKSDGVCKIGGNKLFSHLSKAMGYKSHQAMSSVMEKNPIAEPKFESILFEDCGQDFYEFITIDGLIVDCQPHQGRVWIGGRGSLDEDFNAFRIYSKKKFSSISDFDCMPFYEESADINYHATKGEVSLDYQAGFLDGLNGKDNENKSQDYKFGFNVALYNLRLCSSLKDKIN